MWNGDVVVFHAEAVIESSLENLLGWSTLWESISLLQTFGGGTIPCLTSNRIPYLNVNTQTMPTDALAPGSAWSLAAMIFTTGIRMWIRVVTVLLPEWMSVTFDISLCRNNIYLQMYTI